MGAPQNGVKHRVSPKCNTPKGIPPKEVPQGGSPKCPTRVVLQGGPGTGFPQGGPSSGVAPGANPRMSLNGGPPRGQPKALVPEGSPPKGCARMAGSERGSPSWVPQAGPARDSLKGIPIGCSLRGGRQGGFQGAVSQDVSSEWDPLKRVSENFPPKGVPEGRPVRGIKLGGRIMVDHLVGTLLRGLPLWDPPLGDTPYLTPLGNAL